MRRNAFLLAAQLQQPLQLQLPNRSLTYAQGIHWTQQASASSKASRHRLYPSIETAVGMAMGRHNACPEEVRAFLRGCTEEFYGTQSHDDLGVCGVDESQSAHEQRTVAAFLAAFSDDAVRALAPRHYSAIDLVEYGCGHGRMTPSLAPLLRALGRAVGPAPMRLHLVDPHESLLAVAHHRACQRLQGELRVVDSVVPHLRSAEGLPRELWAAPAAPILRVAVLFGVSQYVLRDADLSELFACSDIVVLHEDACEVCLFDAAREGGDAPCCAIPQLALPNDCDAPATSPAAEGARSSFRLPSASSFRRLTADHTAALRAPAAVPLDVVTFEDGSVVRSTRRFEELLSVRCASGRRLTTVGHTVDTNVDSSFLFFPHSWICVRG